MSKSTADCPIDLSQLACLLAESNFAWTQVADQPTRWSASAASPRQSTWQLTATVVDCKVELAGCVAQWNGPLSDVSNTALANYVPRIEQAFPGIRFQTEADQLVVIMTVESGSIELELQTAIDDTIAVCRQAWREVLALTDDQVAQAYCDAMV